MSSGATITVVRPQPDDRRTHAEADASPAASRPTTAATRPSCTLATGISSSTLVDEPGRPPPLHRPDVDRHLLPRPEHRRAHAARRRGRLHRHAQRLHAGLRAGPRDRRVRRARWRSRRTAARSTRRRSDSTPSSVLDRDPATGLLRQKDGAAGCIGATAALHPRGRGWSVPHAVTVSPDSAQVYVSVVDRHARLRAGRRREPRPPELRERPAPSRLRPRPQRQVALLQRHQPRRADDRRRQRDTCPGFAIFERDADGNLVAARGRRRLHDGHRRRNRRRRRDARASATPIPRWPATAR